MYIFSHNNTKKQLGNFNIDIEIHYQQSAKRILTLY